MSSIDSCGFKILRVLRQALATRLVETNTATAMAVPHVQTLDIVEIVSSPISRRPLTKIPKVLSAFGRWLRNRPKDKVSLPVNRQTQIDKLHIVWIGFEDGLSDHVRPLVTFQNK